MGTNECSQPASKSSWDSQDFGDISMVLKMAHFRKSTGLRWLKRCTKFHYDCETENTIMDIRDLASFEVKWEESLLAMHPLIILLNKE